MKLFYNNETRKLDASELTFEALCSKTQEMFPDCAAACFTYVDSDDDRVTIANQADLALAAASAGDGSLKVYVVDPVNAFDSESLPNLAGDAPESEPIPDPEAKSANDLCKIFKAVRPWRFNKMLETLDGDTEEMAAILGRRWNKLITECNGDLLKVKAALIERKQNQRGPCHKKRPGFWNNLTDELKAQVSSLEDMGYSNRPRNVKLLRKFDCDLDKVVAKLTQEADKVSHKAQKKAQKKAAKAEKKCQKKAAKVAKKAAKKADKESKIAEKLTKKLENCSLTDSEDTSNSSSSSASSSSSDTESGGECNHYGKRNMKGQFPKGSRKLMKRVFRAEKRLHHASMDLFGAFGPMHHHPPHHGIHMGPLDDLSEPPMSEPPMGPPMHHGPPTHWHGPPAHGKHGHGHLVHAYGRWHHRGHRGHHVHHSTGPHGPHNTPGPHHHGPHHGPHHDGHKGHHVHEDFDLI
jgi:vacuolar-type H+-ATPase subunit H